MIVSLRIYVRQVVFVVMTKSKKKKLSPAATFIAGLVESVGGGSQRAFAKMVGCTQPSISRIINGQQEPSRELIGLIAQLDSVDGDKLRATLSKSSFDVSDDYLIPVASSLLSSAPEASADQLTANTIAVSQAIYRPSLYAVRGRSCIPAINDPAERLIGDDLVVIESSTIRFSQNIQIFNERLCVIVERSSGVESITLRRVWSRYENTKKRWVLVTCADAKVEEFIERRWGKEPRVIMFDDPKEYPEKKYGDRQVDFKNIAGIAVQLIRNL